MISEHLWVELFGTKYFWMLNYNISDNEIQDVIQKTRKSVSNKGYATIDDVNILTVARCMEYAIDNEEFELYKIAVKSLKI